MSNLTEQDKQELINILDVQELKEFFLTALTGNYLAVYEGDNHLLSCGCLLATGEFAYQVKDGYTTIDFEFDDVERIDLGFNLDYELRIHLKNIS